MKRPLRMLRLLLLLFLAFTGCTSREKIAEQDLRQQIDTESGGKIKLLKFTKTDGQKSGDNYVIYFEAEIEFQYSGKWVQGAIPDRVSFKFVPGIYQPKSSLSIMENVEHVEPVSVPFRYKIKGNMIGTKMESGWHFDQNEAHVMPK